MSGTWRVRMDEVVEAGGSDEVLAHLVHALVKGLTTYNTGLESLDVRPVGTEPDYPRRFKLVRDEDETGVSGTGVVAYGVIFPDGNVVTRWNAEVAQTCVWSRVEDVELVHGHNGKTRIVMIDD